jgi:predicted glycosyltransferase
MKILFYCQHVLGIGHLFRSLAICRALAPHPVVLVTGGSRVEAPLPPNVRETALPPLMMDADFSRLYDADGGTSLAAVKAQRQQQLFDLVAQTAPETVVIELYPFGRKAFGFELDPVLQAIRDGALPPARVVCSLRDILVEKADPAAYEARVLDRLTRFFDALLIHADPTVVRLEETFGRSAEIAVAQVYTGFVAPRPSRDARRRMRRLLGLGPDEKLIVASAGGGSVGRELLEAAVAAFHRLPRTAGCRLHVFGGPFLAAEAFEGLQRLAGAGCRIQRFTPDFVSYLAAADLSVSMAGYNTSMNILAAGVPALVWPFPQNREQGLRAERLARRGALRVLAASDLQPDALAARMRQALDAGPTPTSGIDLDGAAATAAWLTAGDAP